MIYKVWNSDKENNYLLNLQQCNDKIDLLGLKFCHCSYSFKLPSHGNDSIACNDQTK